MIKSWLISLKEPFRTPGHVNISTALFNLPPPRFLRLALFMWKVQTIISLMLDPSDLLFDRNGTHLPVVGPDLINELLIKQQGLRIKLDD